MCWSTLREVQFSVLVSIIEQAGPKKSTALFLVFQTTDCRYSVCFNLSETHDMSTGYAEWSSFDWRRLLTVSPQYLGQINQFSFIYEEAREPQSPSTEWRYALWTDQLRKADRAPDGYETLRQKTEICAVRLRTKSDRWCWTKKRWKKNDLNRWKRKRLINGTGRGWCKLTSQECSGAESEFLQSSVH